MSEKVAERTKEIPLSELGPHILVGECGNRSVVTGEVRKSSLIDGMYAVETEHGTLFLDEDFPVCVVDD